VEDCTRRGGHLSKRMSERIRCAVVALAVAAIAASAGPGRAAEPVLVAVDRCNSETINEAAQHVRDYDRRGATGNSAQLLQRYGAIVDVIAMLNEERTILNSVCSSDAQRAPLFAQIAATAAWALLLEADLAAHLNVSCPAAAKALPTMMISDAWLSLANVVNERNGQVPTDFNGVISKVQAHAADVGLDLPTLADTSQYWRDQVHAKAKTAIATCPSPSPSPTPT
jgi:hypothetical protein